MRIIQQQQVKDSGCVSACAAMILQRPVECVTDEFHQPYMNYEIELDEYLSKNGVTALRTEHRTIIEADSIYVLLVPSLNAIGTLHSVVLDTRFGANKVYDPARNGAQRYTLDPEADPGFTMLTSWIIDYKITHAPFLFEAGTTGKGLH